MDWIYVSGMYFLLHGATLQLLSRIFISRYDTQRHDLTDYTSARDEVFPGQDYSNPRIKDFYKGNIFLLSSTRKHRLAYCLLR